MEAELELITQESQLTNKDITDMELEVEPQKRKERSTNKNTDRKTVITSTLLSPPKVVFRLWARDNLLVRYL